LCGKPYMMVGSTPIRVAITPLGKLEPKGKCPVCLGINGGRASTQ